MEMKTPIIKTPRMILRAPTMDDLEKFQTAKEAVWPELQNWMSWASDDQKPVESVLARWESRISPGVREDGSIMLLGFDATTNDFVIATGFDVVGNHEYATGYWVAKNYLGKGYATEATNAIIRYVFNALNADAVFINYYEGNEKSRRIIEKLGFDFLETKPGYHTRFSDGEVLDSHHYVRRNTDNLPDLEVTWS